MAAPFQIATLAGLLSAARLEHAGSPTAVPGCLTSGRFIQDPNHACPPPPLGQTLPPLAMPPSSFGHLALLSLPLHAPCLGPSWSMLSLGQEIGPPQSKLPPDRVGSAPSRARYRVGSVNVVTLDLIALKIAAAPVNVAPVQVFRARPCRSPVQACAPAGCSPSLPPGR
ncbi:hypothetical protein D1007_48524 [Hordeum vulgare]|nr:hypothetical protein D1007_48524 [Hordeum vulgare]